MLEEALGIARRHRIESPTHRFQQSFSGTRLGLAQQRLELGKGFFYGVEVRGVGWQVQKLAASALDELPDPRALVGGEVVHDHYLSRRKCGSQKPLDVGFEDGLRGR